jgi:glutaminyl-peptide cyclotransferase
VVPIRTVVALVLTALACACSQDRKAESKPAEPIAQNSLQNPAPTNVSLQTATTESSAPAGSVTAPKVNGARAMQYTREAVAFGPRPVGSAAHKKLEAYIRSHLKGDQLEEDAFTGDTPNGKIEMRNFIAKFPGTQAGLVVIAGHYDTKILKNFVGANDGGTSTGLPLELANVLREHKEGRPTVWIVLFDGEEAVKEWTATDSTYGSRHLAQKWQNEGVIPKIKAFLLLDMVGDKDLDIFRDQNSTSWLLDQVGAAAAKLGYSAHFFGKEEPISDDHLPFVALGVPCADLIDFDSQNSFWHTPQDTLDKLSAQSLEIVGNTVLQVVWTMGK